MKMLLRSAMFAGVAALALAGTALAANLHNKVMTVNLPDGLVVRVEYQGNVAPRVTVERPELAAAWPHEASMPFVMLDRISADMDRQFDTMVRQVRMVDTIPADDEALMKWPSVQAGPIGATHYSYVATTNGRGYCARSVEISYNGPNQKPKVTSSTSGDCGRAPGPVTNIRPVAPGHST